MSSGPSSTSSNEATADRPTELIALLDSENAETVEQTKALIHENLYKSRDPSLLNALVDCYLETRSTTALQILTNIHEARINNLFDKLNDCLKHHGLRRKMDTFSLLGHIVRKQPSWLYKIVKTSFFENVIKCMKTERDVLLLINGILTITTLLPLIPTYVESWLHDLFEIYARLTSFLNSRPGNIPDVYLLHLHVAVYYYFHRIYALYPNNFITFLRGYHHSSRSKQILFQTTIKPMLEHVRLHPCLVTETTQSEVGKHRWRKKEPQDIVIECQSISLDPVDRIQTDSGLTTSWTSWHEALTLDKSVGSAFTTSEDLFKDGYEIPHIKERRMSDSATQTGKSLQAASHGGDVSKMALENSLQTWRPTDVCGLVTPPSGHMSPATSTQDLTVPQSILSVSQHYNTPVMMGTPGESPTSSLAGDLAQSSPVILKGKQQTKQKQVTKLVDSSTTCTNVYTGGSNLSKIVNSPHMCDTQTSTPKSEQREKHSLEGLNEKILEDFKSEVSLPSEPVTPIDKVYNYHYGDSKVMTETSPSETGEELTCGDHTTTTSENVVKEIKRILSETSFGAIEGDGSVPDNPPPSLEVSLLSDNNGKREFLEGEGGIIEQSTDMLENECVENHLVKSLTETTSSNEGICFIAKSSENKTQQESKSTATQDTQTKSNTSNTTMQHQEQCQQTKPLNLHVSQNGVRQEPEEESNVNGYKKSVTSTKPTPVQILDSYIQVGSSVHLNELEGLSLVSSSETDWSHFGGGAPLDEMAILRGQIQLLHHQLLYERHKCDQHATRNRRLIGKTFKAVQYQEELMAIKDHLKLQEEKMRELMDALVKQIDDNRKFKEITSAWDNQQQTQLRNLLNENAQLQHDKKVLKESLDNLKKDYASLNMKLDQTNSKLFSLEKECQYLKPKVKEKDQLKSEIARLTKELVIMGEINQHHKDMLQKVSMQKGKNPETNMQFQSCQKELTASKQTGRKQKAEIEALHAKITDLETQLSKKDKEIKELKKFSESLNGIFEAKIKAIEEKYNAQKQINQSIENRILSLQLALADSKHQFLQKTRTVTRSTSPISLPTNETLPEPQVGPSSSSS